MKTDRNPRQLYLYEEVMLLGLRNQKGTVVASFVEFAVAGAVLAELLLECRIVLEGKKKLVEMVDPVPTGDPVIDECLVKLLSAGRRATLQSWVRRLAGIKQLRHKVAQQLCARCIVRADEDKVALIFTRRIYPELNPRPERQIIERLRAAILGGDDRVDARTVTLIALADRTGILGEALGRREARAHKKRIARIIEGDTLGDATREAIAAVQAAVVHSTVIAAASS